MSKNLTNLEKDPSIYYTKEVAPGHKEKIADACARSAYNNNRAYEGCTRCVLAALNEHLKLTTTAAEECIKASTALAGGVARMGETCGALTGGILALGLVYGSADLYKFDKYVETMNKGQKLALRFKEEFGTFNCKQIQEQQLGRKYNFFIEGEREAWYKDGGLDKCPTVCGIVARMAAEIILEDR